MSIFYTRIFRVLLIPTMLFLFISVGFSQTVRINEFMALNQTVLADEDGDYSDWIELYNAGSTDINLQGWALTDDILLPSKWLFPDITLKAGEFMIVFASSKDRSVAENELHTNFNLSGIGEYLALSDALGNPVTAFDPFYTEQRTDFSYGYYINDFIQYSDATPLADNSNSTGTTIPKPDFSVKHGFFESPFSLAISTTVADAKIYYTKDGSAPTKSNGILYTAPINIPTTSVIRAITISFDASSNNEIASTITTNSYIFPSDVIHQTNTPSGYPSTWGPYTAISGDAIADYEMDPEVMEDPTTANATKASLLDIPTISLVTDISHIFSHSTDPNTGGIYIYTGPPLSHTTYDLGRGWERPVSFEYFDNKDISVQENCGIRLQGGHSRRPEKNPKHSFQLVFKSQYGASKINYPFFGDEGTSKHDRLILRAGFGNSWLHHTHGQRVVAQYQEDLWTKDTQRAMGHPASNSVYVHLYINGIYWGMYATSERMDGDFGEAYMGGDKDDYDVIKDYAEVSDGNITAWNKMIQMADAGLESNEAYQRIQGNNPDGTPNPEIESMVDVVNIADYMLINFYGGNSDWDHHNWAAMRNRVKPDKGFKFMCWDAELMFGSVTSNILNEKNSNCPSNVYQQLLKNDEFKRLLADRLQQHCYNGGVLTPEVSTARWMKRANQIENPVNAESARWGDYRRDVHPYQTAGPFYLYNKEDDWLPRQDYMLNTYFPRRTDEFIKDFRDAGIFPDVDAPVFYINDLESPSSIITEGDMLSMTNTKGTIYYTTNGVDPANWANSASGGNETSLFASSASKKVLVPKSDVGTSWRTDINFDDASWRLCSGSPGGVGYEQKSGYGSLITLDVTNDMHSTGTNPSTSCYIRIAFNLTSDNLAEISSLALNMTFDDGFVAYLNGTKVADANISSTPVWNSITTDNHEASSSPESFDISAFKSSLVVGKNVIAIQGVNQSTTSSDFVLNASLVAANGPGEGDANEEAELYTGALTLNKSAHVIARSFNNGEWSAANDKFFSIPSDYDDLKITEVHYNPLPETTIDGSKFEFIELKNTGTSTLNMGDLTFVNGIDFEFPEGTQLDAGEFIVLASNSTYFYERYGFLPSGNYRGNLDNDGERLVMSTSSNDTIVSLRYNDGGEWTKLPDGDGYSLVSFEYNPSNDQSLFSDWRASFEIGGSPGKDDLEPSSIPTIEESSTNEVVLSQNYPNPFNGSTYIDYKLPFNASVNLTIYNVMGQQIATLVNTHQAEGLHQVEWAGTNQNNGYIPNGIYIYRLTVQSTNKSQVLTRTMILNR